MIGAVPGPVTGHGAAPAPPWRRPRVLLWSIDTTGHGSGGGGGGGGHCRASAECDRGKVISSSSEAPDSYMYAHYRPRSPGTASHFPGLHRTPPNTSKFHRTPSNSSELLRTPPNSPELLPVGPALDSPGLVSEISRTHGGHKTYVFTPAAPCRLHCRLHCRLQCRLRCCLCRVCAAVCGAVCASSALLFAVPSALPSAYV